MKVARFAQRQMTTVEVGGFTVLYSSEIPVSFHHGGRVYETAEDYGRTTKEHRAIFRTGYGIPKADCVLTDVATMQHLIDTIDRVSSAAIDEIFKNSKSVDGKG